jgi:tetratricopeptide (TPR) repeat protein
MASKVTPHHSADTQAHALSNSGHYKEAIRLYKKLWQDSEHDEWRNELAHCYVQYAMSMAKQGDYEGSITAWDEHKVYSQSPYEAYDHYLVWLVLHDSSHLASHLSQLSAEQLDKIYPQFSAVLGAFILAGHSELQANLPTDSAFLAHLTIVKTALQALRDHPDTLNDTLKQLPYRSAFKDFRLILKAIHSASSSTEQAQELLAKIPEHSAYAHIAQLLQSCLLEGSALAQALLKLSYSQRRFVTETKGFSEKQREFIEQFCRQSDDLNDKATFTMAIQYQSLVGTGLAQNFCQSLLATYPVRVIIINILIPMMILKTIESKRCKLNKMIMFMKLIIIGEIVFAP